MHISKSFSKPFMQRLKVWFALFITVIFLVVIVPVKAQVKPLGNEVDGFPVLLDGKEVFRVRQGLPDGISAEQRAQIISDRLQQHANTLMEAEPEINERPISYEQKSFNDPKITIIRTDIKANNGIDEGVLFTARDQDTVGLKNSSGIPLTRDELARSVRSSINNAVIDYQDKQQTKSLAVRIIGGILLILLILLGVTLFAKQNNFSQSQRLNLIRWIQGILVLMALLGFLWLAVLGLPDANSIFVNESFENKVVQNFQSLLQGFIQYTPNLVVLIVIACVTMLTILFAKFILIELGEDEQLTAFNREWMHPSVSLATIVIGAIGSILAIPYLPGFGSPTFLVVLVILGILFVLSSHSVVANAIAGLVLMYSSNLQDGQYVTIRNPMDRLNIADPTRGILEGRLKKYLFVSSLTSLQSGQEVFLPNSALLNSYVLLPPPLEVPAPIPTEMPPQP